MEAKTGFLKINGKSFPYPVRGFTITNTTFVNAGRNANSTVVGEVIGREQYKLTLSWAWLSAEDWAEMCNEFSKFYLDVEFFNPTTNSISNLKMYPGDRTATPYFLDDDLTKVVRYENCKCNLIDMGIQ